MMKLGVEMLLSKYRYLLSGKRIGVVTNYSVCDGSLISVIDRLTTHSEWSVTKLFGPEHGVLNCAKEGEHVASDIDKHSGIEALSLYGALRKPTNEMLKDIDVLVMDLQDVGCRYYTNMNTINYCIEACADSDVPCLVLDRPNPLGGVTREGNLLEEQFSSFVGMSGIPVRHGLTMGELAVFHNGRLSRPAQLTVVRMEGWQRQMTWANTGLPFVPPSPNTSGLEMVWLYPGTCLFEGTNVSEGRGTTHPFEIIGAPYIDGHRLAQAFNKRNLAGVVARPTYFVPAYKKYAGEVCEGVQLHITNYETLRPVRVGISLLQIICDMYPDSFEFLSAGEDGRLQFDLLAGTDQLRRDIEAGRGLDFLDDADSRLGDFEPIVKDVLLYR